MFNRQFIYRNEQQEYKTMWNKNNQRKKIILTGVFVTIAINFWHTPYAANSTEFSAQFAISAGMEPA